MRKYFIILFFVSSQLSAQHWWVDNTGTGDTLSTIAEVNALGSGAGDTISFKKGCAWRETLTVPGSGSAGSYVVYNSYGTGNKPQILGSNQAITWTAEGHTNIWQSATSLADPNAGDDQEIFFIETDDSVKWGDFKAYTSDFSNLAGEYDWTWNANTVYVYAVTDPDARYTSVEVQQRDNCFLLNNKDYIEIDGLEMAYSIFGVHDTYSMPERTGITIRNCLFHHFGDRCADCAGYGIHVCYNNMLIEFNETHDAGRRGCAIYNYMNDTVQHIVVHDNVYYNGTHSTGLDMSTGVLGFNGGIDSIWVYNNLVYEDPDNDGDIASVSFYIDGSAAGDGHIWNFWFYNNIMMWTLGNGLRLSEIYNAYVYNNTFYEQNAVESGALLAIDYGGPIYVKNNIFYTTLLEAFDFEGMCIMTTAIASNLIDADYNLVYKPDNTDVAYLILGVSYSTSEWADIKTDLGWELNSPNPADPLFINVILPMEVDSFMLDALSPAIDAGIGLGEYTQFDYYDSLRGEDPDIGAIEYDPEDYDPPPIMPSITTTTPVARYTRLVAVGGSGIDAGGGTISAKGVCYSTSANPTISDSKVSGGTGTDAFGVLCPVEANKTYHFRAYATNAEYTAYGDDLTATTPVHSVVKIGGKYTPTGNKTVIHH